MAEFEHGDGSAFGQLIGRFGTNASPQKRIKAERRAMMKADDPRRKRAGLPRPCQFNVRITEEAKALAGELVKDLTARDGHPWSQADLVEEAISVLARSIGKVTT